MIAAINKIKNFLSDKYVSVAIVALAVVARIIQLTFFYNIRVDGMYQVMAMQNFVDGHGISISEVFASDLSVIQYKPLTNWPPGYSLLLSPFYILFNHNYILAGLALEILAAIALIFICRRILSELETPIYLVNIFTLLTGFFIYYFYFIASSDALAITFFMIAVYFAIRLIKISQFASKTTASLIVSLSFCGLIKYMFIPIVFIIPAFIFLKGTGERNSVLKKTGIISFLGLIIFLGAVLVYQKYTGGTATYISEPTRGFFPENLLTAWPAFPASFLNPDTVGLISHNAGIISFKIFQYIHFIFLSGVFIFILLRLFKNRFKIISVPESFFYLTFFISAGITVLLMILSLTVAKEENLPGHYWTYIEEPRYYGLINVMIHLGVFLFYQYYRLRRSRFFKYLFISSLLLLLPEMSRGIIFTAGRVVNLNRETYIWQYEYKFQKHADAIIQKTQTKYPGENIVVTGSSYYAYYRVGLYSHIPAFTEVDKINNFSSLNTKKPIRMLVILQEKDFSKYQLFLSNKKNEFAGYFDGFYFKHQGFYFYTAHVKPH
jgi:hypothetical protein